MKNNPLLAPVAPEATYLKTKICLFFKRLYFYVNSQVMCFNLLCNVVISDKIELYPLENSTLPTPTKI